MPDQIGDSEPDSMAGLASNNASLSPTNPVVGDDGEEDMAPIPGQQYDKIKGGENGTTGALKLLGAGQKYGSSY